MEKRRVRLEINGVVCGLITQESDEYMRSLAEEVGDLITEIQIASPYITLEAAAITAALSYCDDAKKNGQKRHELQERVDELEVEAEVWQEERDDMVKNGPNPQTRERIETLERENTALQEAAQNMEELQARITALEDENAALRQETEQMAQMAALRRELERLQGENGRLRQAAEGSPEKAKLVEELEKLAADNAALKLAAEEKEALVQKAEQEKKATVAAAKRAVEEAKRLGEPPESRRDGRRWKKQNRRGTWRKSLPGNGKTPCAMRMSTNRKGSSAFLRRNDGDTVF